MPGGKNAIQLSPVLKVNSISLHKAQIQRIDHRIRERNQDIECQECQDIKKISLIFNFPGLWLKMVENAWSVGPSPERNCNFRMRRPCHPHESRVEPWHTMALPHENI